MTATVDPARCPLCGEGNACQAVAGGATCWCFDATVPAATLARVPAAAKGIACICQRCASASAEPAGSTDDERRERALRWTKR